MKTADILIVDDDSQVSKSICRALKKHNFKILSARNGEDTLKSVLKIRFKIIVSDVKMSGMHGFKLLEKVHDINPDTTRIVLSGHSDLELILKLVNEKGIDRYLVKTWENRGLNLAVGKCIELHDLRI
jgi:response regulator RpfG family c-di-GMP phosphodiesterase